VAPRLDSAFVAAADGTPHFFRITTGNPIERQVGELASFVHVVYSPLGTAVALLSAGKIQVIKGLPDSPAVAATISPRANPRNRRPLPDALAVSDDGGYLLYSAGGPVELLSVAGDSRVVLDGAPGTLAAFAPGSHDAAVIQSGKLHIFNDIAGPATHRTVDSAAGPSDLAYSPDSRSLFIASAAGRSVTTVNLETGDRSSLTCDCAPATLTPMGSVFRLNELGKGPLWLLDPASDRRLIFVPPPANL
jgi:WD40 repeat protein